MVDKNKKHDYIKCSRSMKILLREAKLEFLKQGKKVPSDRELTDRIAKKMKKEDLLHDKFIPFK